MEVVNCSLITMTPQVLLPVCLCEDLLMCCVLSDGCLLPAGRPSVIVEDPPGAWGGSAGRDSRCYSSWPSPLIFRWQRKFWTLRITKPFNSKRICVLTRNQHGGDHLGGLQEVHIGPLEGLTVVGLQVAVWEDRHAAHSSSRPRSIYQSVAKLLVTKS